MVPVGFKGLTVAAFESRMEAEIARLIERHGGNPRVAPALREIPLDDNSAALKFGVKLITERIDLLVLLTGVGTTALFDLLKTRYPWPSIVEALKQTAIVARGPKPVVALKALGLQPTLTVPEPNTWVEVVSTLDEYRPVKGLRVAVQEYGMSNQDLLEALKQRGAEVFQVPIYRWALPEESGAAQTGTRRDHRWEGDCAPDHQCRPSGSCDGGAGKGRKGATLSCGDQKVGRRVHRPHRQRTPPSLRSPHRLRTLPSEDGRTGKRNQRASSRPFSPETISVGWFELAWRSANRGIRATAETREALRTREVRHIAGNPASGPYSPLPVGYDRTSTPAPE